MRIKLIRKYKKPAYTIGILYVDGVYFCETVEDADRGLDSSMDILTILAKKQPGITAIPTGVYKVILTVSPKFKKKQWAQRYGGLVPEIIGVKGYSGARIHPANYASELEGCVAPGENKVKGGVVNSVKWYLELMQKHIFPAWTRTEEITIEIV